MKSTKVNNKYVKLFSVVLLVLSLSMVSLKTNAQRQTTKKGCMSECMHSAPENAQDISPLLVGESIPMVMLKDANGKDFDLNKAVSMKPTILIFYRGGWCPFCSKQLAGLQEIAPELEKSGYQLLAISTDAPEGLMQSQSKEHLSYKLLSDADLNVSKLFGIAFKAPEAYSEMLSKTTNGMDTDLLIPVPSVFILDKKGVIHFEYINPDFKQRLNPDLLKVVASKIYNEL